MPIETLSITTACVSLTENVDALTARIQSFVSRTCDSYRGLDAVSEELFSLGLCLEYLKSHSGKYNWVQPILASTGEVVAAVGETLIKLDSSDKSGGTITWAENGANDLNKLSLRLQSHKASLEIALTLLTLLRNAVVDDDTSSIRGDVIAAAFTVDEITAALSATPDNFALQSRVRSTLHQKSQAAGAPEELIQINTAQIFEFRNNDGHPGSTDTSGTTPDFETLHGVVLPDFRSKTAPEDPGYRLPQGSMSELSRGDIHQLPQDDAGPPNTVAIEMNSPRESEEHVESDFEDSEDSLPEVFGLIAAEQEVSEGHGLGCFCPSTSRNTGQNISAWVDFMKLGFEMGVGRAPRDSSSLGERDIGWSNGTYEREAKHQQDTPPSSPTRPKIPPLAPALDVVTPSRARPGPLAEGRAHTESVFSKQVGPFFRAPNPQLSPPPSPSSERHASIKTSAITGSEGPRSHVMRAVEEIEQRKR
ncbi:hypothetical protein G647_08039 [Cladophialophora carrionii CBS 160.54]|uniref:Fungal N-terminal domain-containing protein n=1 Tax=Cladophialophora carrionii CBS 160.54 TaxID=1279043 RepID=V9D6T1_9EURO|nr:uncharacterized protein G647_08039 [Cladophialophora carrionii CBS 160.54]ETI21692.1 hypothetical protein G647_08039 [Cladophialophora carrionii CBS 160.54]